MHSHNHCCCRKIICIKYYKHVCILALFQAVICLDVQYFPHYLINGTISGKKSLNINVYFCFLYIYHSVKKSAQYYHKCTHVLMQSTCYSYQILIKLEFLQHILKSTHMSNFIKIQPVVAELFHMDRQTGWRDRHNEAKSHFS